MGPAGTVVICRRSQIFLAEPSPAELCCAVLFGGPLSKKVKTASRLVLPHARMHKDEVKRGRSFSRTQAGEGGEGRTRGCFFVLLSVCQKAGRAKKKALKKGVVGRR